jgi:hypothetical protein
MALSFKNIAPFLVIDQNKGSRLFSYAGLGIGVLLLLCSVQLFINISQLLKERSSKKSGFDYISITKRITDQNVGQDHSFTPANIEELKSQKFIADATPLLANKFVVSASGGSVMPFTTDIFLEAIKEDFIDTIPPGFKWKEGEDVVPIIISSDYLELYNAVFAPSRDLPQISQNTVGALMIELECSGVYGSKKFKGNIVALSDRINSVIVPANFLEWANRNIANLPNGNPSRIYLKTPDANNADFLNFLQSKDYQVNKDKTRFGRVKQVLQAVVSGLGIFAILVILLAMMLFSFYLQLLLTLGYSPLWLTRTVAKKWVPVYITIILVALLSTQAFQYFFQQGFLNGREDLSPFLHWVVLLVAGFLMLLCIGINYRLIKKLLFKL